MVKPQLLLKIKDLQRNGVLQKKYKVEKAEGTSERIKMKKENLCRVCLQEGCIPIFGSEVKDNIPEAINTFGCINVTIEDPHPKYLCQTCYSLLQCAILFRKTAQQSEELLKKSIVEVPIPPDTLDRGQAELDRLAWYPSADGRVVSHERPGTGPRKARRAPNSGSIQSSELVKIEPNHFCKKCGMSFETLNQLDDHMLSGKHENKKQVCPYCHKSYVPRYFNNHLKLHTDITAYICHVCGKNFKTRSHFGSHKRSHVNDLIHNCSFCPYKGKSKDLLKMHLRKHTGERPYQCSECPSRFISKSNLLRHLLTHKGTKLKCNDCDRGFYTKRDLELHLKVDHTGVKEHECKFCGKTFGYRKTMIKHELKVHKRAKLRGGKTPTYLKVESMAGP